MKIAKSLGLRYFWTSHKEITKDFPTVLRICHKNVTENIRTYRKY